MNNVGALGDRNGIPSYSALCAQRQLVLVDIENAACGPTMTPDDVRVLRTQIRAVAGVVEWDQIVVGCSHFALLNAKLGWPDARFVVRSGPDGADLALLAELGHLDPAQYAGLVPVSGDHLFAPAIAAAALPTLVIGHRGRLSKQLQLASTETRYLPYRGIAAA